MKKDLSLKELIRSLGITGEAFCLRLNDMPALKKISKQIKKYKVTAHFRGFDLRRTVIPVYFHRHHYFADLATGTLFDRKTGQCMTSSFIYLDLPTLKVLKRNT